MDLPVNTKEDIENNESINLVGEVIQTQKFDDGNELYHLQDAEGNGIELKIWASEADEYNIESNQWYLLEQAEGDIYQDDQKLGSNRGEMKAVALNEPPGFVDVFEDEVTNSNERTEGGIVAVDIETVATVPETELDLDNSDHLELLCVGVGYAPSPSSPSTSKVLFRQDGSIESEANLIERFCEYVEIRNPDQLLLFRGDFDLTHLPGRARRVEAETNIADRIIALFDEQEIVNLSPPGSLEENIDNPTETHWDIYQHSLNPADWRTEHPRYSGNPHDSKVTNKDISNFGERYLGLCDDGESTTEYRALHELIRHYTVADIDPLFELANSK